MPEQDTKPTMLHETDEVAVYTFASDPLVFVATHADGERGVEYMQLIGLRIADEAEAVAMALFEVSVPESDATVVGRQARRLREANQELQQRIGSLQGHNDNQRAMIDERDEIIINLRARLRRQEKLLSSVATGHRKIAGGMNDLALSLEGELHGDAS